MAKVLVGVSGGVDSAVAAYLLKQQGHEVIAGFMKNYAEPENPHCHTREDRNMAIKVAHHLGIKTFIITDFREEYHERIIQYIYDSYQAGITPNPDVYCNSLVKFDLFLQQAHSLGCSHIATGHYAQLQQAKSGEYALIRGKDRTKDQSYFLSQLNQQQLSHSMFPLGGLEKTEIRALAKRIGLPNAERPDSQGLCFIGDVPIAEFLQKKIKPIPGEVLDTKGKKVGTHQGAIYYTIGQRHGFQTPFRAYVVRIDISTNTLIVTDDREDALLYTRQFTVTQWHRIREVKDLPHHSTVKIRYRQKEPISCTITAGKQKGEVHISLEQKVRALAPGQFAVAYDSNDEVIGSGVIAP